MLKNYNNTYIGIPLILRRQRSFLLRKFPELIKYRRKYDPIHILEAISIYCEVDANGDYCRQIIHIGSLSITSGDIGMWSAVNAVDSIGVSYTYARGKQLVVRNSLLYGREVTFVRIFLAYFETHIGYNARIAPAVTFKICSKISASTTPKI